MTGSIFFILAGVVLLYSTFFFFFFLAELLDSWIWRWAAFPSCLSACCRGRRVLGSLGWRSHRAASTISSLKETRRRHCI